MSLISQGFFYFWGVWVKSLLIFVQHSLTHSHNFCHVLLGSVSVGRCVCFGYSVLFEAERVKMAVVKVQLKGGGFKSFVWKAQAVGHLQLHKK